MFFIRKPTQSQIERFLEASRNSSFSYTYVGSTQKEAPESYTVDHNRLHIGNGEVDWEKAKRSIHNWKMFEIPWVELCWPNTPVQKDQTVAILIRHFGFFSLNSARIVYVIDEPSHYGFAYGTLADHGESGEERFSVEIDRVTGEVWYDLFAFSRPNHFLAKLGYPLMRVLQKRFAIDSKTAMLRAMETIG